MSELKQLESFVAVVKQGSLSAAARQQGVVPAVIGRRLDALENRLGVKLLLRTTRSLTLTQEGSAFYEDCLRILGELSEAEAAVASGSARARTPAYQCAGGVWSAACGAACGGVSARQSGYQGDLGVIRPDCRFAARAL